MVMDGLSAQSVGREFVRQYYTMLHEAPKYLHRFYSHDSSFLHDGMTPSSHEQLPAIGQTEINRSIESLNFHDCHARIRQVDSQPSVAGSVVIQVVGELSNNAVPLRRFMQTFVLVPQSPKKFYVHNDIFRYQDEVFAEVVENNAEATVYEQEAQAVSGEQQEVKVEESVDLGYQGDDESPNGNTSEAAASEPEAEQQLPTNNNILPPLQQQQQPTTTTQQSEQQQQQQQQTVDAEEASKTAPPEKLSWAAMARKGVARNGCVVKQQAPNHVVAKQQQQQQSAEAPRSEGLNNNQQQQQQQQASGVVAKQHVDEMDESGDGAQKRRSDTEEDASKVMQQYPDNQQVFIGNIPHNMPDSELHDFFAKFGSVLDIRINRKNNNNLPNFGFVLFESPEVVQSVLSQRPLYNGKQRVNVEEKKRKEDLSRPRSSQRGGKVPRQPHKNTAPPRHNIPPPPTKQDAPKIR